ncbi:hypothetical protein BJQ94_16390 [Cryobacterium sp. SO2]|uniref:hypothetical protein n=1 Tax=Cryobacterium sp. SO2 TaxID=1897060 RepID=UPI00223E4C3D|nr:hypothetical protein [Cryobacterium sp. SO2]WEO76914.1 hypothetical protein BJQ94_16390 [Cryobacterium sp. SO2]
MNRRAVAATCAVAILIAVLAYAGTEFLGYRARQAAPSEVDTVTAPAGMGDTEAAILFRNTAQGAGYGAVASVSRDDPSGERALMPVACDRVDATASSRICLSIDRGVVTTFTATSYDSQWQPLATWPLPGVPSRTRFSDDGRLVAYSAFITGESYATIGFSISTTIVALEGTAAPVDLEDFTLTVNGDPVTSADRNFWGVTFGTDDNTFYATGASGGQTWLLRGDLAARTLVAIRDNAECPSLSPDGTRVAYKTRVDAASAADWNIAVLDLATNRQIVLPEDRSVDDQVEWLDDSTLLYGLARADAPGDSDVWSIPADGTGAPERLIEHAWSPAVIGP